MTSHFGDIRSAVCEQSRPAGEQSRSLELRYYKPVGPCVWKCTCCGAGVRYRRDVGGAEWDILAVCQSPVSRQVLFNKKKNVHSSCIFSAHLTLLRSFRLIFYFSRRVFLFAVSSVPVSTVAPSPHSVLLPTSPHVILYSSPPSLKCRWAAEQYPGGHGDRQPPPGALFLPLSPALLLLGSCTLLSAHILASSPLHFCSALASIMGETLWRPEYMHQSRSTLGKICDKSHTGCDIIVCE